MCATEITTEGSAAKLLLATETSACTEGCIGYSRVNWCYSIDKRCNPTPQQNRQEHGNQGVDPYRNPNYGLFVDGFDQARNCHTACQAIPDCKCWVVKESTSVCNTYTNDGDRTTDASLLISYSREECEGKFFIFPVFSMSFLYSPAPRFSGLFQ